MDIITVCRTLNEERNIERFCEEYGKISNKILIADGGSEDRTIEIAESFDKVEVKIFDERVEKGGIWRNPHGKHINFMIDWAKEAGADWIIFDDCDSVPNKYLKEVIPPEFSNPALGILMVQRLYLYKNGRYFPRMSSAGAGLWAWRANVDVRASEEDPWAHHMETPNEIARGSIMEPRVLLHYSWPDDEEIQRKAAFYRIAKDMKSDWHPLTFGGGLAPIPEWAIL